MSRFIRIGDDMFRVNSIDRIHADKHGLVITLRKKKAGQIRVSCSLPETPEDMLQDVYTAFRNLARDARGDV